MMGLRKLVKRDEAPLHDGGETLARYVLGIDRGLPRGWTGRRLGNGVVEISHRDWETLVDFAQGVIPGARR